MSKSLSLSLAHTHIISLISVSAVMRTTVSAYSMLSAPRLRPELSLIYGKPEFSGCKSALALFTVIMNNNLQDVFLETLVLITTPMMTAESETLVLITTPHDDCRVRDTGSDHHPMMTAESECWFSTLKRVKTFLLNMMHV